MPSLASSCYPITLCLITCISVCVYMNKTLFIKFYFIKLYLSLSILDFISLATMLKRVFSVQIVEGYLEVKQ